MTTEISKQTKATTLDRVLIQGDLATLDDNGRVQYFQAVCNSIGLNPLTKPFEFIKLNGKVTLYARKDATDQLRKLHGVSIEITKTERIEDVYVVTACATDATGRKDSDIGAVNIAGLKGDSLANALMKAETKAKRRVTLSICGLGILDETEVETIPNAKVVPTYNRDEILATYMQKLDQAKDQESLRIAYIESMKEMRSTYDDREMEKVFEGYKDVRKNELMEVPQ